MWLGSPPAAFTGRLRLALRGLLGLHVALPDLGKLFFLRRHRAFINFLGQSPELRRHQPALLPLGAFVLILTLLAKLGSHLAVLRSPFMIMLHVGVIAPTGDYSTHLGHPLAGQRHIVSSFDLGAEFDLSTLNRVLLRSRLFAKR